MFYEDINSFSASIWQAKVADLQDSLNKKKAQSAVLMESTSKAKKRQSELEQKVSEVCSKD